MAKDIDEDFIIGGVPAKIIKKKFD